jgi:hypothetical protein
MVLSSLRNRKKAIHQSEVAGVGVGMFGIDGMPGLGLPLANEVDARPAPWGLGVGALD